MTNIATKVDAMVGDAITEICSFTDSEAAKNPILDVIGIGFILFILSLPILFGLLCVSVVCREIEVRGR